LLRTLEGMHASVFGIVGFCVGTLVWLWMWWVRFLAAARGREWVTYSPNALST
jgi:hypothetical protein